MKGRLILGLVLALSSACRSRSDTAPPEPLADPPSFPGIQEAGTGWDGARADDWLSWRGPEQVADSVATGLPETLDPENPTWSLPISGRGTPVIADGRVYAMGYVGEGETIRELMLCLDERDGTILWQKRFRDLFSDTVYSRYAVSSPTVDPETGNVYFQTTGGLLFGCTRDGEVLWQHSLVEEYGRLTFPNGRTGAPLVDEDKVIVHIISVTWGPLGPARDRYYAFDKRSGECLWVSTPGVTPIDNSFCMPYVEERGGKRVMYVTTGCGYLACIDVRTGDPLWRFRMATGAANASVVVQDNTLVAIHGGENLDASSQGRMVGLRIPENPAPGPKGPVELDGSAELWRHELEAFSSSPALGDGRVYQTDEDGELVCVNPATGEMLWKRKMAADQVHASPLFADGRLWVPMNNGTLHVLRPTDEDAGVQAEVQLAGNCMAQPSAINGRLFIHTTQKLYCFGGGSKDAATSKRSLPAPWQKAPVGEAVRLQVVPADLTARVGDELNFRVRSLDSGGRVVAELTPDSAAFDKPDVLVVPTGETIALRGAKSMVGVLKVKAGELEGSARVRLVPTLPFSTDFEDAVLDNERDGVMTARGPGGWYGAAVKWAVMEKDGSKILTRIMDNPLFQRTISLIGHPDDHDYTMQVDVAVEGNRRSMSTVGVVHQRYRIELKGNYKEIEVSSNVEALKVSTPFDMKPRVWYTLKSRVDLLPDGSGIVRAKVWPRDEAEPSAWTIEVPHADAHQNGAYGLLGFTPQSRLTVYVDNLSITPDPTR